MHLHCVTPKVRYFKRAYVHKRHESEKTGQTVSKIVVAALYKFVTLEDFTNIRPLIAATMEENSVRGTILLAREGINGTVAGSRNGIDSLLTYLRSDPRLSDLVHKESYTDSMPFLRSKVRLKKEIVTLGVPEVDPTHIVGTYVNPEDWNDLIQDPDVVLIDTRNDYEVQIGTFKDAVNPNTESFREFPLFTAAFLGDRRKTKVAMFCTGGIRCEKSTAFLKSQGFNDVYHLKGGILKYLEDVPEKDSLWEGECFVFDERVAVNHDLEKGQYDQCHACRRPITEADKSRPEYQRGVSCHFCFDKTTDEQRARYREREKQIRLAESRGDIHIGCDIANQIEERRALKWSAKERQRQS
jgi:UPF0176 protein